MSGKTASYSVSSPFSWELKSICKRVRIQNQNPSDTNGTWGDTTVRLWEDDVCFLEETCIYSLDKNHASQIKAPNRFQNKTKPSISMPSSFIIAMIFCETSIESQVFGWLARTVEEYPWQVNKAAYLHGQLCRVSASQQDPHPAAFAHVHAWYFDSCNQCTCFSFI